jgi:hypothetical protein
VGGLLILLSCAFNRKQMKTEQGRQLRGQASFFYHGSQGTLLFCAVGLLLATVMIMPLSELLWKVVPLLEMVQFPWRFLSVQALFAAVMAAAWVMPLKGRHAWAIGGVIALLLLWSTLAPLRPERLLIGPDDVTTTRLQEYETFTGNIGTTVRYEWLPKAVVPRPFTSDTVIEPQTSPAVFPLAGTLENATQLQRRPTEQVWSVQTDQHGTTLAFPLLYWPGWRAWVDGKATEVWATESAGYLALEVPGGAHIVRLKLERTSLRAGAEILSLVALLFSLTLVIWGSRHFVFRITYCISRIKQYAMRHTLYVAFVLIGLLFLSTRSSPPPSRLDDLTMDFVAMPYLHHNPDGVEFVGAGVDAGELPVHLLGYSFSSDRLRPGDILDVNLEWHAVENALGDHSVSLRLVSPAEHLADPPRIVPYALAVSSRPLVQSMVLRLTVPENTPRGLYLLQLSLQGKDGELSARTPSGEGRGPLYLRPVRVTDGAPVPAETPMLALVGPDIRLYAAELEPTSSPSFPSALTAYVEWSTEHWLIANLGISVRLLDPDGNQRVTVDTQPGYGFTPTSLWRPRERVADRYTLSLPDDLPPADGYRLSFVFYRHPSAAEVARVTTESFALPLESPLIFAPRPRLFEVPSLQRTANINFTGPGNSAERDHIRLAGYDLREEADALDLTLWWVAQRQPLIDYTVFLHLFDPADESNIITQTDAMPRQGSYPTTGWLAGEVVSDTIRLSLSDVPPGEYRLALGLYDLATRDRLAAITPDGVSLPDGRFILPDPVEVAGE